MSGGALGKVPLKHPPRGDVIIKGLYQKERIIIMQKKKEESENSLSQAVADDRKQPLSKGNRPSLRIRFELPPPPTARHSSQDRRPVDDYTPFEPFKRKLAADDVDFFSITEDKSEQAQQSLPSNLNAASNISDMPKSPSSSRLQRTELKSLPLKERAHNKRKSSKNPDGTSTSHRRTSDKFKGPVRKGRKAGPSNSEDTGIDQDRKTEEFLTENNLDKTTTAGIDGMQDYFHPDINTSAITFRDLELLQDPDLWLIIFNTRCHSPAST
ncbi:hypothetical protein BJ165DRAFT_1408395 [Panaeolus papilionaceus]|nr:hypothetical protein BJ165DRAFT_1408395 [Panaeolus papilionaceus]